MKPGLNKILIVSAFVLAAFTVNGRGQSQSDNGDVGQVAGSFLAVTPSVRMASLGGEQAAASGDVSAAYSNPASLSSLVRPELFFSHNQSFIDTKYDTLAFGFPFKDHAFAFSGQFIDEGSEEKTDIDATTGDPITGIGNFRYTTTILHGFFSTRMGEKLSLGGALKGWSEKRDGDTSDGWAGDAGIQIRSIFPSLDAGVSVRNFGPKREGHNLPRSVGIGFAFHLINDPQHLKRFSILGEADVASYRDAAARLGLEWHQNFYSLRAGYQNLTSDVDDPLSSFSFGGGLRVKGIVVDYAFLPKGELGDQHRISLSFGFGLTPEERALAAKQLDAAMTRRAKDHARENLEKGQQFMAEGNYAAAREEFSQSLTWDSENEEARAALQLAGEKQKFAEADRLYNEGLALSKEKQWLDASLKWQQVLNLVPSHKDARRSFDSARLKIQNQKTQRTAADESFDRGVQFYLAGQYDKALESWKTTRTQDPDRASLNEYIEKAKNLKLEQEFQNLKQEAKSKSGDVSTLSFQAYTFYRLGQIDKSIEIWNRVMALDPSNKEARIALSEARQRRVLTGEAAASTKERKVAELNARAMEAYGHKNLTEAAAILRQALAVDPNDIWISNNLKRIESELGGDR